MGKDRTKERNWKKELRKILEKNNMSEEYIEETLEYGDTVPEEEVEHTDDERMDEPVITYWWTLYVIVGEKEGAPSTPA